MKESVWDDEANPRDNFNGCSYVRSEVGFMQYHCSKKVLYLTGSIES